MLEDRALAAKAEAQRLLDAKVIREVKYSDWLANMVLLPKKNGKIRMCIDFTDLISLVRKTYFHYQELTPSSIKPLVASISPYYIASQDIIRYG